MKIKKNLTQQMKILLIRVYKRKKPKTKAISLFLLNIQINSIEQRANMK